ncbi:MAG: sulfatase [Hyphomonadaceae bacterium]|nr:sulfatase [Hyphomonadaceae bacterium]
MQQTGFDRRGFLQSGVGLAALAALSPDALAQTTRRKPNVIIVLADDLGYGDLGAYGAKLIRTPNLDRMAKEGAKLTSFYASANICTPSRAGLMTGRYPIRTGLGYSVIQPNDKNGLPLSEITMAEALKPDYATALIGKWHLGHVAPFWPPTQHGFDLFFGLPYSHDMKPLSLYNGDAGVELTSEDVDFSQLTARFFDRGLRFVEDNKARPFFLMLTLTAPHVPLVPHPDHLHESKAGAYGDVVQEIDSNVGKLLAKLKALNLDKDTLVIVTSDNGPWFAGSSGSFRERKGGAGWDGGYRVPFIARQPGAIPGGVVNDAIAMNIDLVPTICAWAGKPSPGVTLDGLDIAPLLKKKSARSPHEDLVLFNNEKVVGIRTQDWKFVTMSYYRTIEFPLEQYGYTQLADLKADPGENYDVSSLHPDILADMKARLARARATYEPLGVRQAPPAAAPR